MKLFVLILSPKCLCDIEITEDNQKKYINKESEYFSNARNMATTAVNDIYKTSYSGKNRSAWNKLADRIISGDFSIHSDLKGKLQEKYGFNIDKDINMGHLKGCLNYFIKEFFEVDKIQMRFRPSHFPFTEPSAEVDIGYQIKDGKIIIGKGDKWLEILGCGMVHPNVLKKQVSHLLKQKDLKII